jgi:hypothetical protein
MAIVKEVTYLLLTAHHLCSIGAHDSIIPKVGRENSTVGTSELGTNILSQMNHNESWLTKGNVAEYVLHIPDSHTTQTMTL